MKPSIYRRVRRRTAPSRTEGTFFKKESQETFFGGSEHDSFFKSTVAHGAADNVQRKCEKCEEEEKQVQREPEKKEEEKVMKKGDKKEEEKVMKKEDKKEEEKVMKKEDKKEEEEIQREPEKKEDEKLQKKETTSSETGGKSISNYINTLSGKGESLPPSTKHFFSARMGYDFSDVRVHKDKEAADSAKAVNAKAYAVGNDIVFNEGQFNTGSSEGQKLMAHELTHVVQQNGSAINMKLQRQVAPPVAAPPAPVAPAPAPHFRDCVRSVTGIDNADDILFAALNRARDFVNTAIDLLDDAPEPGTVYETALATHFGRPLSDRRRRRIQAVYRRILANLEVNNFICNRRACPDGHTQAMWDPSDDLLHICLPFWRLGDRPACEAIVIIHEAAHDAGIDLDDPATAVEEVHTPNRGRPGYPVAGGRAVRPSRSVRANTPDAYAFFSAHVHNGVDTPGNCF